MSNLLVPLSFLIAGLFMALPAQAQRSCPSDRPCILAVYNERTNLIVEWNDTEDRDHYNLRWSHPGKSVEQVEIPGGSGSKFTVKDFLPDTRYTFAVQGCRKPLVGRSECTPWYEETALSCGARATPCRGDEAATADAAIAHLVNHSSSYCLDTDGRGANGGVVRMWNCVNHPNQLWEIQGARLKNRASGFCLDTDGRAVNGGAVRMWTCVNHPNQLWEIRGDRLKNKASGFCLDSDGKAVNGGAVRMWECVIHPNQSWRR